MIKTNSFQDVHTVQLLSRFCCRGQKSHTVKEFFGCGVNTGGHNVTCSPTTDLQPKMASEKVLAAAMMIDASTGRRKPYHRITHGVATSTKCTEINIFRTLSSL